MNSKYSPWDWASSFRMHQAAALIAGVQVSPKREPDTEELSSGVVPVLNRLLVAWAIGENYRKGAPVSPDYPASQTLLVESMDGVGKPIGILVKRAELCRWIEAMGLPSAYDFREPSRNDHAKHAAMPEVAPAPEPAPAAPPEAVLIPPPAAPDDGTRPVQRQHAQEQAIMRLIREAGHDPLQLPMNEPGKPGIKSHVKKLAVRDSLFTGANVFGKAWDRLRSSGEIADQH